MKKILVVFGHPVKSTYEDILKKTYVDAAIGSGATVKELILRELNFEINFREGYRGTQELEPDLKKAQELISWADHLVFFYPNWWATYPALLKGFIDRTFLPGFAFKYRKGNPFPEKLLTGKSARVVVTMDAPPWYYYLHNFAPGHHAMRKGVLHFCGIKPVRISSIGPIRGSSDKQREKWIKLMDKIGTRQR